MIMALISRNISRSAVALLMRNRFRANNKICESEVRRPFVLQDVGGTREVLGKTGRGREAEIRDRGRRGFLTRGRARN